MTLEEAPLGLDGWTPQRTRWLKGYWQTLGVHFGLDARRRRQALPLAMTLGGAVLSALVHGPALAACLVAVVRTDAATLPAMIFSGMLVAGYAGGALGIVTGMRRAGLRLRPADLLLLPAYWSLQAWPAARALLQLVRNPYLWEKTEHGVSAQTEPSCTSRSRRRSPPFSSPSRSLSSPAGAPDSPPAPNADRA